PFLLNRTGPAVVGYADAMDLNRTGRLRQSDEVAFEVEARDAGDGPKTDLEMDQRFRGAVLDHYERGRWGSIALTTLAGRRSGDWQFSRILIPRPQRGEFTLSYTVPPESSGLFLADPFTIPDAVPFRPDSQNLLPIASLRPVRRKAPWHFDGVDFTLNPV